jgi:hypothetical protein
MKFDRWGPPSSTGRSLAFFGFEHVFTEINDAYWGGLPGSLLTRRLIGVSKRSDDLGAALGARPDDLRRVGTTMGELSDKFKESEHLRRLGAIVHLLSGLEVLVLSLTSSAEQSDPLLGYRSNVAHAPVDGFALSLSGPFALSIPKNSFTRGTWPERVARLCRYFTLEASGFPDLIRLERARKLRNTFAHGLGREIDANPSMSARLAIHLAPPMPASEEWLKKLFGDALEFARYLDTQLVVNHIGAFEVLSLYHEWLKDPHATSQQFGYRHQVKNPLHHGIREFSKLLSHAFRDSGRGREYMPGLREYYLTVTKNA